MNWQELVQKLVQMYLFSCMNITVSLNVSGIGEIVEKFVEEPLEIEVITPSILCDTKEIYKTFRENFYKLNKDKAKRAFRYKFKKDILKVFV